MGVIDEVRSHVPGNDSGSSGTSDFDSGKFDDSFSSDTGSGGLDSDFNSDLGSDIGQDPAGGNQGNPAKGRQNQQRQKGQKQQRGARNQGSGSQVPGNSKRNRQSGQRTRNRSSSQGNPAGKARNQSTGKRNDMPNAQAGRPREGSSKPQLSSQTQEKMRNAGMDPGQGQRKQRQQPETVADRQDDLEQLKSQNEQIIELLKRINQNLKGGGRR